MKLKFHDLHPEISDLFSEVYHGLLLPKKSIPPKFFYDERGSDLFNKITELDEYYLTDAEKEILRERGSEIGRQIGPHCVIIEYGCGSSEKIHLLLDHLSHPHTYMAIDISKEHLVEMTEDLAKSYPDVDIHAICADFTQPLQLPLNGEHKDLKKIAFFPGSSIGNFDPAQAKRFLRTIREEVGPRGGLLIGVDLKKDTEKLQAAYNDSQDITAQFNKNLLVRINRECHSNFDLDNFQHQAFYNAELGRIEMHLESKKDQIVALNDTPIPFKLGETIHTENSYKFSVKEFLELTRHAGWNPVHTWTDSKDLFSIHYLETATDSSRDNSL